MKAVFTLLVSVGMYASLFSQESIMYSGNTTDPIKTVSEIEQPEPAIEGAPKHSDVCFSPRWPTTRNGEVPLEVAPKFHATRLEWVYLTISGTIANSGSFVKKAHEMGYTVCGSVNSLLQDNLNESPAKYTIGRARNLDSSYISFSWLPGTNNGCVNNPDFVTLWLKHAKQQTDIGADHIQMDDPGMNGNSYICYCVYCAHGFAQYLADSLASQELADLGIPADTSFDYRQYRIRIRDDAEFAATQTEQSKILLQHYKDFQIQSTFNFFLDVHQKLDAYTGRNILYSCNSINNLFLKDLYKIFQMSMCETYPEKEGVPGYLYEQRVLPMRRLGKPFIGTFVSPDIQLNRRFISQMYAFGKQVIVPWDVYMGSNVPRLFATPAECADLYGFVRANSGFLDEYWEAAVAGVDLNETRYEDTPPIHLRGGSLQVRAVVRARPGGPDAPVVIHMVEWAAEPEPFTIVLDPHRFFGDKPIRVTLSTPSKYNSMTHQSAENSGDYSKLSVDTILAEGRLTSIEIPELSPWGLLKVEPVTEPDTAIWQPMLWMETDSYFTRNIQVHLSSPTDRMMIRYTLDGSEPKEESSLYSEPLIFSKTATIRACAFDSVGKRSPEVHTTFTYLGKENSLKPDTTSLATNLKLWLRADTLSSTLEDGQPVNTWLSGAGPAASQQNVTLYSGNISESPVFRKNAINGMPVVSFEEPNHSLGILNFSNLYLAGKQFTIFMVSQSDDNSFGFCGNALNGGGGIPRLYLTREGMHYDILSNIAIGAQGKASIATFGYDGKNLMTWSDGKPGASRAQASPMTSFGGGGHLAIPFWGGNTPHLGQMAEIIIYNRSLSDFERTGIESFLSEKYALHTEPVWKATPAVLPTAINLNTAFSESLHIFPNPGNGSYLNIEMSKSEGNEIFVKIYDLTGTEMINRKVIPTDKKYHLALNPDLLPGIYIMQVIDRNKSFTQKFIVSR